MKGLKVSMVIAVVMTSFAASGQRTCLDGCQDGNRVSLTFNPRAAQAMFDSLYFRLDSLTAYVAACGCGGAGTGGSTSGGGSGATPFTCGTSTVTFDGHAYSTVQIGTQCWFAENLRTTQYADNSAIPEVNNGTAWSTTNNGARAAYNNDPSTYGYLYNWYAVDSAAGLCPTGWHVPTDGEWTTLANGLGGPTVAGREMKSSASDNPSWDGTNSSGFSGLPGGFRLPNGVFIHVGTNCFLWSTTPAGGGAAWGRSLSYLHDDLYQSGNLQTAGFSVRCLQN